MAEIKRNVSWAEVEKHYDWFKAFRFEIAKYGNTTGHIWKRSKGEK